MGASEKTLADELIYFNGLRGDTGEYMMPPTSGKGLSQLIRSEEPPANLNELRYRTQQGAMQHRGVVEGVDPKQLDKAGWGILFAYDAEPAILEALSELIAWRREQAGNYFKIYQGADGYRPDESKREFLARHGVGAGPADPKLMPYYLLIVGSPAQIPYVFQYELDVQRAVGRIHFDTPQEYANYARSVVAAEKGDVKRSRRMAWFSAANEGDKATQLSQRELVTPLHEWLQADQPGWQFDLFAGAQATKAQLSHLLGGDQTPALLFTASHGMAFPKEHALQRHHQGALVCQDWPGPDQWKKPIPQDFYFAGDDLAQDASLLGMMAFCFACYGAGTPLYDDFSTNTFKPRTEIAPQAFVAGLPTRMLTQPRGGALAVVGHVERAWGYSFSWPGAGKQTAAFESTLKRLLEGHPIGSAIEFFNERYAELATDLSTVLDDMKHAPDPDAVIDAYELVGMWTAHNDARGYAIVGDPAVRLAVSAKDKTAIEQATITVAPLIATERPLSMKADVAASFPEMPSIQHESSINMSFEAGTTQRAPDPQPQFRPELLSLKVSTYTSPSTESNGTGKLVAMTEVSLEGNLKTTVSSFPKEVQEHYLNLHSAMVKEALATRLAYLQLLSKTVSPGEK